MPEKVRTPGATSYLGGTRRTLTCLKGTDPPQMQAAAFAPRSLPVQLPEVGAVELAVHEGDVDEPVPVPPGWPSEGTARLTQRP